MAAIILSDLFLIFWRFETVVSKSQKDPWVAGTARMREFASQLTQELKSLRIQPTSPTAATHDTEYTRIAISGTANTRHRSSLTKIVLIMLDCCWNDGRAEALLPVLPSILPEVCLMQADDHVDLQHRCMRVLQLTTQQPVESQTLADLLGVLGTALKTEGTWKVRLRTIPILEASLIVHNFNVPRTLSKAIFVQLIGMLQDPQVDIRARAALALTSILKCGQKWAVPWMKAQFEKLLAGPPLRARGGARPFTNDAVLKRHAGVLGMASLIQAFPYTVPEWLPSGLMDLTPYIGDVMPIQSSVRLIFREFKRTHQDSWAEDQAHFTAEQLEVLSGLLIAPTYYA